uniref:XK-related protein n=2 Tax=Bursaphelenchus xylophilus TaxID=6326 RepID=A0A1I7SN59_BURXY
VCAYAVILWAAIEALETATYMLLGNLRQFPNEEKQFANTRQGILILAYLLFLSFSVSLHCYFFYIFWRDYNFICEYPRKKQTAAEDKRLLKEE